MNVGQWLLWSFAATVVLTVIMSGSQVLHVTRMNVPYLLGTMVSENRDRARMWGVLLHVINGWLFGLIYLASFHALHLATWWWGALVGLVHGLFVLTVGFPMLPALHPRMASETQGPTQLRPLEPPGFMGRHYGIRTPASILIAHLVFGAILGFFYTG